MNGDAGYSVMALSELISLYQERDLDAILSEYRSVRESDTEDFLHIKAIPMEKRDLSRTFIAMTPDMRILGYVSLSIKCMRIPDDTLLSRNVQRQINVDSRTGVAQSYLIGQLSRSVDAPKGLGAELIRVAMRRIQNSKMNVGCRMVRLDCRDELVPYYQGQGFRMVAHDGNSLNPMMTLV
ncbi:MAG: hypothetical protein IKD00_03865 [Candidatus Methanomethylophilaceae archaeon]|nr:hypothetical protein [Candidatus Methanomethylophilaceae archaeon]